MFERGGLVVLATFALYVWIAPSTIMNGDNADFAAVGTLGGAAHPSGYPLYVLWLRAWSWLPGTPAHATAIATILLAAATIAVLHAACRAWGARPLAATVACALFATGPIVLRIHTEADVFPLNCLICATVIWLSATEGPLRGVARAAVLAGVAGLGIAHNLTCVAVAPIGILGVVRGVREAPATGRAVGLAAGAFVLGLSPYAYLLLASETPVSWGKVDGVESLVRHVLRLDYGSFKLTARDEGLFVAANLRELVTSAGAAYLWLPALCGVGAIAAALARPEREPRAGWIALVASLVLAGPVLVGVLNKRPVELGLYLTQRFHILALLVFGVFVAVGLDRGARELARRVGPASDRWRKLAPLLACAAFVVGAALALPWVARVHSPAVERSLRNVLGSLPPAAILIGTTDELHFGTGYLQAVAGVRPDVQLISVGQLGLPYYRERLARRSGLTVVEPAAGVKLDVALAEQALATGRPVFIDPYQAGIAGAFATYPYGLVFRVLPRGTAAPSVERVFELNKELYARYTFGYPFPGPHDQLPTQIHRMYARAWTMIAQGLEVAGKQEERAFALAMAAELEPRSR